MKRSSTLQFVPNIHTMVAIPEVFISSKIDGMPFNTKVTFTGDFAKEYAEGYIKWLNRKH